MSYYQFDFENFTSTCNKNEYKILSITSAKYDKYWHSIMHSHHFSELFFVTEGAGVFKFENEQIKVKKNSLIAINPYVEHTEISIENNPLSYIAIGIDGILFSFENSEKEYGLYDIEIQKEEFAFYINQLVKETQSKNPGYYRSCKNLVEMIILILQRNSKNTLKYAPSIKMIKQCVKVKDFIDSNFKEDITLDVLAEKVHMNKYYLVHTFTKYMGMSPINYLVMRRIKESEVLLKNTNYSVMQISDILGFSSQSYFSQKFKKINGVSPIKYRQSL